MNLRLFREGHVRATGAYNERVEEIHRRAMAELDEARQDLLTELHRIDDELIGDDETEVDNAAEHQRPVRYR